MGARVHFSSHPGSAWFRCTGHILPDLSLLSNDPYDLPDAESEHGIVEILNMHFKQISITVWKNEF